MTIVDESNQVNMVMQKGIVECIINYILSHETGSSKKEMEEYLRAPYRVTALFESEYDHDSGDDVETLTLMFRLDDEELYSWLNIEFVEYVFLGHSDIGDGDDVACYSYKISDIEERFVKELRPYKIDSLLEE